MWTFKNLQKWLPRIYSLAPYYFGWKHALPPAHVFFEVTYRCNLRCQMCHYLEIIEDTETNRTFKNELSAEKIKSIIKGLPKYSLITFTGGEAFMKSEFLDILEFTASRHKVHIITNGTMLNERVVNFLIQRRVKSFFGPGIFYIGVSLEGVEKLHDEITQVPGSFAKTKQGLERLTTARGNNKFPLTHLTCVIDKKNVMELVPLYCYAESLGINVCNFALKNPAEYNHYENYNDEIHLRQPAPLVEEIDPEILRKQLDQLIENSQKFNSRLRFSPNFITVEEIVRYYTNQSYYKDYRCYIPWSKAAVSAYGDVFSCPHYPIGKAGEGEDTLSWDSQRVKKFRKMLKEEKIFPGCLGCCQSEYIGPTQKKQLTPISIPAQEFSSNKFIKDEMIICK